MPERQIELGAYPDVNEFVNHVLALAKKRRRDLKAELLKGLNRRPARPFDEATWDCIRRESEVIAAAITAGR